MACYGMTEAGRVNFVGECGCWPFGIPANMSIPRAAASTILSIVYDIPTVSSADDPTVTHINKFTEIAADYASPGNYLVEFFPWMLYIPSSLAKWKREAREGHHQFSEFFCSMVHDVQHRIVRYCSASSCRLLIYAPCRTKGMNARVLLETYSENAIVTTSVIRNLLGCLLLYSAFGPPPLPLPFGLQILTFMSASHSAGGATTVSVVLYIEISSHLRFAERHFDDLVFSRHDCIPREAKEVSRGA